MPASQISVKGIWWRINRGGGDPIPWTADAADGRWQTGALVRGFYLADSEDTAWAEWYRHTSEQGAPPASRMPRDTWKIAVDVDDIADLTAARVLTIYRPLPALPGGTPVPPPNRYIDLPPLPIGLRT